jgi:non-ribosomal peptide synthetase-like protein
LVVVGKRLVLPRVRPGIYPVRSWFGLRKWLSDHLIQLSLAMTNTLYATLYLIPFLRLLGVKVGRWSEVSTVGNLDPDLLVLDRESFVADIAVIGPAVFQHGCVAVAPVTVGRRSFVGNGALIPIDTRMGDNSLIGVYTVPSEHQVAPGTSWLGVPAIFLPRRQESQHFDESLTFTPHAHLVAWRLFIEFFRVSLPMAMWALSGLGGSEALFRLAQVLTPAKLALLMPLVIGGMGLASTVAVAFLKWLIIGRYRPRVEPLWSIFVRRSELITGLYEGIAVPAFLIWLTGTPWIACFLRLFGADIGRRVWLDTTYLTEFDLVHVGDDAAVGDTSSLQTHLFEDRVMKMSTVIVGAGSSVGVRSVILYDAEVGPGASLDALSLVMKGEVLPPETRWRGIPARAV